MSKDAESTVAQNQTAEQPVGTPTEKPADAPTDKPAEAPSGSQSSQKSSAKGQQNKPKKMSKTLIFQTVLGILFSLAVLAVLVYFVFVGVPNF